MRPSQNFRVRSLFLGAGILSALLSSFSASAVELTVSDSIAPATDFLMPFGSQALDAGATAAQTVTISNPDTIARELLEIKISGEGASAFTLDVNGGDEPCGSATPLIAAGGNCTVSLTFRPDTTGVRTAFLNLSLEEEKIAFHDATTNGISLYGVTSGGSPSILTLGTGDDFPSWSPDGTQITFHRSDGVYRMPSGGGAATLVSDINVGGRATMPDWSPDGNKIVMRDTSNGGLFLFDLSLTEFSPVLKVSSVSGEAFSPDWAPDSQSVVFRQAPAGGQPIQDPKNIFTKNVSSASQNLIVSGGFAPSWSPDGLQIAFQSDASKGISRADAGGGLNTSVPLTTPTAPIEHSQPSWSPDGDKIVLRESTSSGDMVNGTLHIIDSETGELILTLAGITGRTPAWSPASLSNVTLTGTGLAAGGANNPPTAPVLVSPENGATGLGSNIEFKWLPASDPDGDPLTYELLLCQTDDYPASCPAPTVVAKSAQHQTPVYAASGALFFIGLLCFATQAWRKKPGAWLPSFFLIAGTVMLVACDGGGKTSPATGTTETTLSSNVGGLIAETSYNWQITAKDGKGGETASLLRTFSTGP